MGDQPRRRQTKQSPTDVAIEWHKKNIDPPYLHVYNFGIPKGLINTFIQLEAINFTVKLINNNVSSYSKMNFSHMQWCAS